MLDRLLVRSLAPSLVALVVCACKKSEEPLPAASGPEDRRKRCERIGDQMAQMGVMMARGLAVGLSDGKAKLEDDEEAKLKEELRTAKAELVEECMGWPEEALDCFGMGAALNPEKCERVLAEINGEAVPPAEVPAGPQPAWSFTLPQPQSMLHGCDDGSVIAVADDDESDTPPTAIAVHEGKERWRKPLADGAWSLEPLDKETVLVLQPQRLLALAIADGKERWVASLPEGTYGLRALLREGEAFTLLDGERRLIEVDLARCAAGPCAEVITTLPSDDPESALRIELDGTTDLVRLPDGGLVIAEPDEHRLVVLDGTKLRFAIESRVAMSWTQARGDALVIALDGELLGLDVKACGTDGKTFAPATWPPATKADWVRDATVREGSWADAPEGCVRWRRPLAVAEAADPPLDDDGEMIVQAGGFLFALTPEAERWKSPVAAQSFAVRHGDRIAVLGDLGQTDTELAMMWLDPSTGSHVGRTPVALGKGELFLMDGPALLTAGPLAIASYERELVAFAR